MMNEKPETGHGESGVTIKAVIRTTWRWKTRINGRKLWRWRVEFTADAVHDGYVQSEFQDISLYDAQQEAKRVPLMLGYLREEIMIVEPT